MRNTAGDSSYSLGVKSTNFPSLGSGEERLFVNNKLLFFFLKDFIYGKVFIYPVVKTVMKGDAF